jgi:hypothetical protein
MLGNPKVEKRNEQQAVMLRQLIRQPHANQGMAARAEAAAVIGDRDHEDVPKDV